MSDKIKVLIIAVVLTFVGLIATYLATAFILLELNPLHWNQDNRVLYVFIVFSCIGLSIPIAGLISLED